MRKQITIPAVIAITFALLFIAVKGYAVTTFGPVRLAPSTIIDKGKVRLGGESPSFGPVRARVR